MNLYYWICPSLLGILQRYIKLYVIFISLCLSVSFQRFLDSSIVGFFLFEICDVMNGHYSFSQKKNWHNLDLEHASNHVHKSHVLLLKIHFAELYMEMYIDALHHPPLTTLAFAWRTGCHHFTATSRYLGRLASRFTPWGTDYKCRRWRCGDSSPAAPRNQKNPQAKHILTTNHQDNGRLVVE